MNSSSTPSGQPTTNGSIKTIRDLAENGFISHGSLNEIEHSNTTSCQFCRNNYKDRLFLADCYTNQGQNMRNITICESCLTDYDERIKYGKRLVVADHETMAIDEILEVCRDMVDDIDNNNNNKNNQQKIDFFEVVKDLSSKNKLVRNFIGDHEVNESYRKLWPIRFHLISEFSSHFG